MASSHLSDSVTYIASFLIPLGFGELMKMASDGTKEVSLMTFVSPSASYESCKNTQEHQLLFPS
jgi:hypothetical protein